LADDDARAPAFGRYGPLTLPFDCAAKTGTSKGYRDNWTVGFTPRHVVGVWVGNFDGRAMVDVSGITGAGPLFRDLMLYLEDEPRGFEPPAGLETAPVCSASGERAGSTC